MKWRHMESKQRREQERAVAAQTAASRSACNSVPTSIACNSRQPPSGISPSTNAVSRANISNMTNSEITKPTSIAQLGT